MKGAIVFLIVFIVAMAITLGDVAIPPGRDLYNMLNITGTSYLVLGIPARTLIISIFNGVVYGFVVWLIYTIIAAATGKGERESQIIQQTVTVQTGIPEKERNLQFCTKCGTRIYQGAKFCPKCRNEIGI